jgi:hypothetical protein
MPWWVRLWCSYLQYYPIWASSTEQLVYIYETPLQGAGGASIIELIPICRWLLTLSSSFAHARASTRLRKKDVAEKREGRELQLLRLVESTHRQSKTTEGQIEYGSPGIVRQRGPVSDYITGGEEMRDIKKTELDQGGGEKLIFFFFRIDSNILLSFKILISSLPSCRPWQHFLNSPNLIAFDRKVNWQWVTWPQGHSHQNLHQSRRTNLKVIW